MSEEDIKKVADELHDAICDMEVLYGDICMYLKDYAKEDEANSVGYELLERVAAILVSIGEPYTKLARYTHE